MLESSSLPSIRHRAGPRSVLFLHPSDEAYGADRVLLQLVLALKERGWRVGVLLSEDQPAGWLSHRLQAAGVRIDRGPLAPARRRYHTVVALPAYLRGLVRARGWVRRRARQFGADVIHVNTSALLVAAVLGRPAGASLVWHIHEIIVRPRLVSWIFRLAPVLVADRVVAISAGVRDHLSPSKFRRNRISVVWNGIEPRDPIALGSRAHPTDPRIAFVGRLNRWKGYELFVEAAARLIDEFPSARFVIAGDPPPGEEWRNHELMSKIDALQLSHHFDVHGFYDDVPALLEETDIVAVPSIWPEPFGLVILEAMRAGCAVVATAHGGALEIIEDGRSGLLVPPGSVSALTDAIARLLRDPAFRSRISTEARQRVARDFTVTRATDEIERVYLELLAPRREDPFGV